MDDSNHFLTRHLARRIAAGLGVTFVVTGMLAGCGAKVVVDQQGAGGTGGGGPTTSNASTGTSSSGTMTCGVLGQLQPFLACFEPGADGCPSKEDAVGPIEAAHSFGCTCQIQDVCFCLDSVIDGPKSDPNGNGLCCYDTMIELVCVI